MKRSVALLIACTTLGLCGCQSAETASAPKPRTAAEVDAEITQIQNNPGMPAPAKQQALERLRKEREKVAKP